MSRWFDEVAVWYGTDGPAQVQHVLKPLHSPTLPQENGVSPWVDVDEWEREARETSNWQRYYLNRWERHEADSVGRRVARTDRAPAGHHHHDGGEERPVEGGRGEVPGHR